MNTKVFLEGYREIETLIENNWDMFCKAYDSLENYAFKEFTLNCDDKIVIESEDYFRGEYDYGYAYVPIEWFESDEILKSHLTEKIKANEEKKQIEAEEEEKRKIECLERQKVELQKQLDEYYKTHPRKVCGGNFN